MDRPSDGPPRPPAIRRSLSFGAPQLIGVPLLLVLPVLALLGVFGVKSGVEAVSAPGLEARISYPERFRYKNVQPIEISVRNTGEASMSRVTVVVDRAYLAAFSHVQFTPEAQAVTSQGYIIELRDIPPGGEGHVSGSVQAEEYGRHRGAVHIAAQGGARLQARLKTLVFP